MYSDEVTDVKEVSRRREVIFIIDDEQEFRLLLSETLVDEGYVVNTAKDAESALEKLRLIENKPDLIIVDFMLPGKTGMEFRKEQLNDNLLKNIPTIFLSGQGLIDGETCLMKPFIEIELLKLIKSKINKN